MTIEELMAKYGNASEAPMEVDESDQGMNNYNISLMKYFDKI